MADVDLLRVDLRFEGNAAALAAAVTPAGGAVFEALRIEAGFPLYGVDISEDNIAQEAGRTKQAISFTKGCYLGQEPIARLDAMGHVNRELRGMRLAEGPVPRGQTPVFDESGAQQVGTITSAAMSYADNKPVALAMLRAQATRPGTSVRVRHADQETVGQAASTDSIEATLKAYLSAIGAARRAQEAAA